MPEILTPTEGNSLRTGPDTQPPFPVRPNTFRTIQVGAIHLDLLPHQTLRGRISHVRWARGSLNRHARLPRELTGQKGLSFFKGSRVDSPFFATSVLLTNRLLPLGF